MDYTDLYNFQTRNGIIVPETSEVLLGIQTKFEEIFGKELDLSAETPVGRLIEAFAVMVQSSVGVTAQAANQFNIKESTGIYLDALGQIFNLKRIEETKTQIKIRCYFDNNPSGTTTIPAGALIMAASSGAMFSIDSAIENSAVHIDTENNLAYADGTATATLGGPITVSEGAVNTIHTNVTGWVAVKNTETLHTGTDLETDEEFRRRILNSRSSGIGFYGSLNSTLNGLSGMNSSCVIENSTGYDAVMKGVPIPPHSIFVCVDCIETDSLLTQIARAISIAKPVGVGMVNSDVPAGTLIVRTIDYGYGNGSTQTVSFYKAKKTAINIGLTFKSKDYALSDISGDIVSVIQKYLSEVGVGGTILASVISTRLINTFGIEVVRLWLQKEGSETPSDDRVEMLGYEVPFTSASYVVMTKSV